MRSSVCILTHLTIQVLVVLQHTTIAKTGNDARLATKGTISNCCSVPGFNGDRGIQEGNLYVLRHSNMPAVLVELGFISNPNEERVLQSPSNTRRLCKSHCQWYC